MNTYFFTFGQGHYNLHGRPMKDYYVRVDAPDPETAREKFINNFTSVHMAGRRKWAFQYNEHNFDKCFFPNGQYAHIQ